ncbi:MAG: CpsD/CapB family tyrosine-protein kinase [Clostridiales bacterium]|nr:CpsD/CapB family tyrosine-protein kinase [Clostridiales bacterium]
MAIFGKKKNKKRDEDSAEFLLREDSAFSIQEAYKALRTNVQFSMPGGTTKCIGITSSAQSEGKSMNTVNLAVSFGQIGKRVLLMDCDMRLPTVATKLNVVGQPGLSNVLVGENTLDKTIQTVEDMHIDVLPAGTIPPDPTSLLESEQMEQLLETVRKKYDYIFIDLPPVTTVADGLILAKYIDGFLLVIKHGHSQYRAISAMMNQLKFADAKVLGFIYANAPASGKKYYHGYYSSYAK